MKNWFKYIFAQPTQPEFAKWFEGSKVVDKGGNPMIVYHGTQNDIKEFSPEHAGTNSNIFGSWNTNRSGIFFTPSHEFANEFAFQGGQHNNANIMPVYLAIFDPIDLRDGFSMAQLNELEKMGLNIRYYLNLYPHQVWEAFDHENDGKMFVEALKKLGYDGALITDISSGDIRDTTVWVAFDPSQIKSATGNKGTFNIDSMDFMN